MPASGRDPRNSDYPGDPSAAGSARAANGASPSQRIGSIKIDVPTPYVDSFIRGFAAVGWVARDTGRTISTDDGEEWLSTLLVDMDIPDGPGAAFVPSAPGSSPPNAAPSPPRAFGAAASAPAPGANVVGGRAAPLPRDLVPFDVRAVPAPAETAARRSDSPPAAPPSAPSSGRPAVPSQDSERATTRSVSFGHAGPTDAAPYARNAILSLGDLVIGDNVEVDADISATGSVTIGRDASVLGSITTGGDLRMGPNAVVSDAACGGRIILGKGAEVTGRIEAVRGMGPESDRP